jgi:predicted nucleic acid binding AN1-type Zn finger protein
MFENQPGRKMFISQIGPNSHFKHTKTSNLQVVAYMIKRLLNGEITTRLPSLSKMVQKQYIISKCAYGRFYTWYK